MPFITDSFGRTFQHGQEQLNADQMRSLLMNDVKVKPHKNAMPADTPEQAQARKTLESLLAKFEGVGREIDTLSKAVDASVEFNKQHYEANAGRKEDKTLSIGDAFKDTIKSLLPPEVIGKKQFGLDQDRLKQDEKMWSLLSKTYDLDNKVYKNKQRDDMDGMVNTLLEKLVAGSKRMPVAHMAAGGKVMKPKGTDTVPAMLTPGEVVVQKDAAAANSDVLAEMNRTGGPAYMAAGGMVPPVQQPVVPQPWITPQPRVTKPPLPQRTEAAKVLSDCECICKCIKDSTTRLIAVLKMGVRATKEVTVATTKVDQAAEEEVKTSGRTRVTSEKTFTLFERLWGRGLTIGERITGEHSRRRQRDPFFSGRALHSIFSPDRIARRVGNAILSERPVQQLLSAGASGVGRFISLPVRLLPFIGHGLGDFVQEIATMFAEPMVQEITHFQELRQTAFQTQGINAGVGPEGINAQQQALRAYATGVAEVVATGQQLTVIQRTWIRNMRRGIREVETLNRVSVTGLNVASMLGSNAEETANLFADWHQNLSMSARDLAVVGIGLRDVARSTGVTGDNLVRVARSSEQFMRNMRSAGTLTPVASTNITRLMAEATTTGTQESMQRVLETMTRGLISGGGNQQLAILGAGNDPRLLQQMLAGTALRDPGNMRQIAGNLQRILTSLTAEPGTGRARNINQISPEELGIMSQQLRQIFGDERMGVQELQLLIRNFQQAGRSFTERLDAFRGNDQRSIENRQQLIFSQSVQYLTRLTSEQIGGSFENLAREMPDFRNFAQRMNITPQNVQERLREIITGGLAPPTPGIGAAGTGAAAGAAIGPPSASGLVERIRRIGNVRTRDIAGNETIHTPDQLIAELQNSTTSLDRILQIEQMVANQTRANQDWVSLTEQHTRQIEALMRGVVSETLVTIQENTSGVVDLLQAIEAVLIETATLINNTMVRPIIAALPLITRMLPGFAAGFRQFTADLNNAFQGGGLIGLFTTVVNKIIASALLLISVGVRHLFDSLLDYLDSQVPGLPGSGARNERRNRLAAGQNVPPPPTIPPLQTQNDITNALLAMGDRPGALPVLPTQPANGMPIQSVNTPLGTVGQIQARFAAASAEAQQAMLDEARLHRAALADVRDRVARDRIGITGLPAHQMNNTIVANSNAALANLETAFPTIQAQGSNRQILSASNIQENLLRAAWNEQGESVQNRFRDTMLVMLRNLERRDFQNFEDAITHANPRSLFAATQAYNRNNPNRPLPPNYIEAARQRLDVTYGRPGAPGTPPPVLSPSQILVNQAQWEMQQQRQRNTELMSNAFYRPGQEGIQGQFRQNILETLNRLQPGSNFQNFSQAVGGSTPNNLMRAIDAWNAANPQQQLGEVFTRSTNALMTLNDSLNRLTGAISNQQPGQSAQPPTNYWGWPTQQTGFFFRSFQDFVRDATTPGSIYVHDTHLEKLFTVAFGEINKKLDAYSGLVEDVQMFGTLLMERDTAEEVPPAMIQPVLPGMTDPYTQVQKTKMAEDAKTEAAAIGTLAGSAEEIAENTEETNESLQKVIDLLTALYKVFTAKRSADTTGGRRRGANNDFDDSLEETLLGEVKYNSQFMGDPALNGYQEDGF